MSSPEKPGNPEAERLLTPEQFHLTLEGIVDSRVAGMDRFPLSVLYCDLNNFKLANDVYDHSVGDMVLSDIRGLVAYSVRTGIAPGNRPAQDAVGIGRAHIEDSEAFAYKLGGDEIGVIARTKWGGAEIISGRIREGVANFVLGAHGYRVATPYNLDLASLRIGISIGIAEHSQAMSASDLKSLADSRLKLDKERQREEFVAGMTQAQRARARMARSIILDELGLSRGEAAFILGYEGL